jgi:(p)ppGpp synthase/HD superfamily hydrolase
MFLVTAYLHDVIEDCGYTVSKLQKERIPTEVAVNVEVLSRKKGETYFDYIMRVKNRSVCRIVKIADLEHNISDLKEGSMKDKYRLAKYILENTL